MLAYAANRPVAGKRESSPNALLLVISVHVALLALLMSAKMDFPRNISKTPPLIPIPVPLAPPPNAHPSKPQPKQPTSWIDHTTTRAPTPLLQPPPVDTGGTTVQPTPSDGGGTVVGPPMPQPTPAAPIHHDPRLLTPASELKPPYPASKLASEEEATLQLRLTIDDRGRVTAVDPVGYADREFLDSARRYIIAHWRYQPASDDGRAIGSTITVTLRFQLDS